jgi:putative aldouronate transport system permease protein
MGNMGIYLLLGLVAFSALFPLVYVFVVSITPMSEVARNGGFNVFPHEVNFQAYKAVFSSPLVPKALQVTITITVLGTLANLLFTMLMAYPLATKSLPFRSTILMFLVFTLLFSGGLIPTYLVVHATGLIDTLGALIVPGLISTFYLFIMKTFFENFPEELIDSARIDGVGEIQLLFSIILPLSKPVIATLGLFYGVTHWNDFFSAIMYINNPDLMPLQVVLRNMLVGSTMASDLQLMSPQLMAEVPGETFKMALVIVSTIPIMLVYPFLQKYLTQGMLLGAVKG